MKTNKIDIERKDFYLYDKPELKERTRERLIQINEIGMEEVGFAQFGIEGVMSGLYIEKVWSCSDEKWNEYIEWVKTLSIEKDSKKLNCDFCKEKEAIGVYAVDHGPFSLAYCEECLKHRNLRTIGNALLKWGRFGDRAFEEYKDWNKCEPQVYYNGEYMPLRKMIEIIKESDVDKYFSNLHHLKPLIIERLKKRNTTEVIKDEESSKVNLSLPIFNSWKDVQELYDENMSLKQFVDELQNKYPNGIKIGNSKYDIK